MDDEGVARELVRLAGELEGECGNRTASGGLRVERMVFFPVGRDFRKKKDAERRMEHVVVEGLRRELGDGLDVEVEARVSGKKRDAVGGPSWPIDVTVEVGLPDVGGIVDSIIRPWRS